jgi:hypothetical protein
MNLSFGMLAIFVLFNFDVIMCWCRDGWFGYVEGRRMGIVVAMVMKMICVCWFLKIERGVIGHKFEKCTPEKLICPLQCKDRPPYLRRWNNYIHVSFSAFFPTLKSCPPKEWTTDQLNPFDFRLQISKISKYKGGLANFMDPRVPPMLSIHHILLLNGRREWVILEILTCDAA